MALVGRRLASHLLKSFNAPLVKQADCSLNQVSIFPKLRFFSSFPRGRNDSFTSIKQAQFKWEACHYALKSRSFMTTMKKFSENKLSAFNPLPKMARKWISTTTAQIPLPLVNGGPRAERMVSWWLFGCSGWVFSMVVLGGVTRLTRSGLSMTDWKFTGGLPPMTLTEWQLEFEKYKASPEYKRVNLGMKLEDFKFIYWMEYAHRMWGRALGLVFLIPCSYFTFRGYITRKLGTSLAVLGGMGACQGFVGWWMVKSGLEEPKSEYAVPRVSPYRLAAHLASAFVIYSGLFWTALNVAYPAAKAQTLAQLKSAVKVRPVAHAVAGVVGVTAFSGAFVAGNDAGHAYNTFPKMGDDWIPPTILELTPVIKNFFENTATVQFDHRVLALASTTAAAWLWVTCLPLELHPATRVLVHATLGMTALQVTLGVSTLLTYVPVSLGSAHQAGALTLFTVLLSLMHSLRKPSPALMAALSKGVKL